MTLAIERLAALSQQRRNRLLFRTKGTLSTIDADVASIIDDVRKNGDAALRTYTEKFDGVSLTSLTVSEAELDKSVARISPGVRTALETAIENITAFHESQRVEKTSLFPVEGVEVGRLAIPLDSVGIYAPGGRATYPSSVIMAAVPARVAGVKSITVCTPPAATGAISDVVLAAARLSGVSAVHPIGGVQAIAALAYGTASVSKVLKIVGPGNVYVTAAKRQVSGDVAIDFPAGPSEVLIIADQTARADFIAADMLAQMEHDPQASAVLVTVDRALAEAVRDEFMRQKPLRQRKNTIDEAMANAALLVADSLDEACAFSNAFAPEHLEIQTARPKGVLKSITNAGSIFLGNYAPVPVGDYCSGTNHILPTAGYAAMYSGVSVDTFLKRPTYQYVTKKGLAALCDTAVTLAELEGLEAHAAAITKRFGGDA